MEVSRTYSNRVQINSSIYDILLTFYQAIPVKDEEGKILSEEHGNKTEIYMSPQHAKALLNSLRDQIIWYEDTFGEIILQPLDNNK